MFAKNFVAVQGKFTVQKLHFLQMEATFSLSSLSLVLTLAQNVIPQVKIFYIGRAI